MLFSDYIVIVVIIIMNTGYIVNTVILIYIFLVHISILQYDLYYLHFACLSPKYYNFIL